MNAAASVLIAAAVGFPGSLHCVVLMLTRTPLPARSISTVYRALCTQTQETVIVKVYDRAKMKPKNFARLEREVRSAVATQQHPAVSCWNHSECFQTVTSTRRSAFASAAKWGAGLCAATGSPGRMNDHT